MIDAAQLHAQLQRAQSLHQAGRPGEAWAAIAPLRAAIANQGEPLRLYALIAQGAGQIDASVGALRQIIAIERDPPEVIGALADMLGKAGQHDAALTLWTRLVSLRPDLADAHLNRAVTAANAGNHQESLEAADEGLKRFAGHARLLATRAQALKNLGRITDAIAGFELAVAADPNRALTRHNQGVALRAACRFAEACDAYAESERLGMKGAQFLSNWGAAALEAGQVDEAADHYRRALDADPSFDEASKGLTRLDIEFRDGKQAFAHYADWAAKTGAGELAWARWADALTIHNRFEEAADVAEQGLASYPDNVALRLTRAVTRGMSGDAGPWLDLLEAELKRSPENPAILAIIPPLALRAGRPERAARLLEATARPDNLDQVSWSLLSIAWRLLDDPREHWLCDYDRLVMICEVIPPESGMSPADYAGEVAAALDPLHRSLSAPGDQSLRGGTQTSGALFSRPEPAIQRFRDAVRQAAETAVATLGDDSTHPFLSRKSSRLGFYGSWSVRLRGGGHHVSHVHNQGWMSSAYYARLPDTDEAGRAAHEGWIQFGVPPAMFDLDLAPRRIVEPQPGRLVLFPSYMWHGTIPFSQGDRLTAAFDYQPL